MTTIFVENIILCVSVIQIKLKVKQHKHSIQSIKKKTSSWYYNRGQNIL